LSVFAYNLVVEERKTRKAKWDARRCTSVGDAITVGSPLRLLRWRRTSGRRTLPELLSDFCLDRLLLLLVFLVPREVVLLVLRDVRAGGDVGAHAESL
jgi:hypothetical protein